MILRIQTLAGLVLALALAAWLPQPAKAQVVAPEVTLASSSISTSATVAVTLRAVNASTGAPMSGLSVIFEVQPSGGGAAVSSTAPRTTDANGQVAVNLGPVGIAGSYQVVAVISGAVTPNPTRYTGPALTVTGSASGTPGTGSSTTGTGSSTSSGTVSIPNPIKCNDAACLIGQVVRYVLGVIAILATLMFIWGGILMLTSGGNSERVKQAKETLAWAAIGIVVILLSWAIILTVLRAITRGN